MVHEFTPRTELGRQVQSGKVTSIDEIFKAGLKIREPWIVDRLLPDLQSEILFFGGSPGKGGGITRTSTRRTVRMHRSGRRFRISALVVVGSSGYIGLAKATANEHATAISKANEAAKLNIIPIKRGCGSWECRCGKGHTLPVLATGKSGSVVVKLMPAPKGIGLCIADEGKKMLKLAGVQDIWTKTEGQSRTRYNYTFAVYNALKSLNKTKIDLPDMEVQQEKIAEVKKEKDETAEIEAQEATENATEAIAEKKKENTEAIARPELEGGVDVGE